MGHFPRNCRGPKKNYRRDNSQGTEKVMKMIQDMMVNCNSKPENFQSRRRLQDESFPIVTVTNVK